MPCRVCESISEFTVCEFPHDAAGDSYDRAAVEIRMGEIAAEKLDDALLLPSVRMFRPHLPVADFVRNRTDKAFPIDHTDGMDEGIAQIGDIVTKGYAVYTVVCRPKNGIVLGKDDAGTVVTLAEREVYLLKPQVEDADEEMKNQEQEDG